MTSRSTSPRSSSPPTSMSSTSLARAIEFDLVDGRPRAELEEITLRFRIFAPLRRSRRAATESALSAGTARRRNRTAARHRSWTALQSLAAAHTIGDRRGALSRRRAACGWLPATALSAHRTASRGVQSRGRPRVPRARVRCIADSQRPQVERRVIEVPLPASRGLRRRSPRLPVAASGHCLVTTSGQNLVAAHEPGG